MGTVFYKQAKCYISDCLKSIINQTMSDFDVLILLDDIDLTTFCKENKEQLSRLDGRFYIVSTNSKMKIYQLRVEMIRYAYDNKYDLLILIDCDDICACNRVEEYINQFLPEYSFFYNELVDFGGNSIMPNLPDETVHLNQLLESNYLGLTNTALNINKLSLEIINKLEDGKTNIFDWYLFTVLLLKHAKGKKIKGTRTFYRLYEDNIAGKGNSSIIEREYNVKIEHYSLLESDNIIFHDLKSKYILRDYSITEKQEVYWWGKLI